MITPKDIRISINNQLKKTGIEINARDVKEGFNRPSFFVQLDNSNRYSSPTQIERTLTVRIYYFPTDRYKYSIEVLDMQDTLEQLFDLKLKVKDRWLNIEEFNSYVNDGVLNCSFDLEFEFARDIEKDVINDEFREEHPIEDMEKLYFEQE